MVRQDLLELAADYAEFSVLITTAELDPPGPQILYANSAFTRITGYSIAELLGKTPRLLQGPKTDRSLLRNLRTSLTNGQDFIARAINYRRSGEPFELEWIISHLKDITGQTTHYIAIQRDITGESRAAQELKRYDEEMRAARSALLDEVRQLERAERRLAEKQRLTALGEMAAGVMHDISNALTPVFSLVQALRSIETLPAEATRITASMDSSIEHALRILGNLKRYYGDDGASLRVPVELAPLLLQLPDITRANRWNESRATPDKYRFSIDAEAGLVVSGNDVELLQVLVNLVLNAVQAMPDGGTVGIRLEADHDMAVLSVSDTGVGMSEEEAESCFEPYVSSRRSGSGLGLAVCRRIIEQHGGTIAVAANLPTGTTFSIRLPMVELPEPTSAPVGRVLLVTDESAPRQQLADMISALAVDCVQSPGGDAALQAFFDARYDAVIIDTQTRPLSCRDLTQAIRRTRPTVRIFWWVPERSTPGVSTDLPGDLLVEGLLQAPVSAAHLARLLGITVETGPANA